MAQPCAAMNMTAALLVAALMASSASAATQRTDAVRKMVAARSLETAGLPDPNCHTGVISMKVGEEPQVCCAGYCGECSDYPTCKSVRGQNSTYACCKNQVYERRCGNAPANVCLKSCSESVPPCIMDDDTVFTTPDPAQRNAGDDCNEAVADWRAKAEAATEPAG